MGAPSRHVVVMGVGGCGKSTVAAGLSERLGLALADADLFHPQANVAKMAGGIPLTDEVGVTLDLTKTSDELVGEAVALLGLTP